MARFHLSPVANFTNTLRQLPVDSGQILDITPGSAWIFSYYSQRNTCSPGIYKRPRATSSSWKLRQGESQVSRFAMLFPFHFQNKKPQNKTSMLRPASEQDL